MVSDKSTDDPVATVATKVDDLDKHYVDGYWNLVKRCLKEVFGKTEREATNSVRDFRSRTTDLTEENRLLIYHNSPLQIAAALNATRPALAEAARAGSFSLSSRGLPRAGGAIAGEHATQTDTDHRTQPSSYSVRRDIAD